MLLRGPHPELAPIAFLSALSLLLPLPWHWRNGNVATLSMIAWLFTINMIYGVGAAVWANDVIIRIPVFCDIATKLIIGSTTALPAAGLCICIRLYKACAARGKPVDSNPRSVRIWEIIACYGVPSLFMALHYIVQGHRYDLVETFGCRPALFFSIPGILLVQAPPIIISFIALIYGVLSLHQIYKHYHSFISSCRDADSSGNLSFAHYVRLMILSLTQIFWVTTVSTVCLIFNFKKNVLRTYFSWDYVHLDFQVIWTIPAFTLRRNAYLYLYITWYIIPVSTLIFVSLFSFGEEAVLGYRRCFKWIYTHTGLRWVGERLSTLLPQRLRQRRTSVLPPIEFNKPQSTTLGTYTLNFNSTTRSTSSFTSSCDSPTDLEKGAFTSATSEAAKS